MPVEYLPSGDTALTVQFGYDVERSLSLEVMRIRAALDGAGLPGVVETVTTYRSMTIHYDPLRISQDRLIAAIEPLLENAPEIGSSGTTWFMPVCYDREFALDLDYVAEQGGITAERAIEIHASVKHYVYMIGFQSGQPHMGDLPEEMTLSRRQNPRTFVEKGSVLIATGLTVVYPNENPSGWNIIGRTPLELFDYRWERPTLLTAGDTVICEPISRDEYDHIRGQIEAGAYAIRRRKKGA